MPNTTHVEYVAKERVGRGVVDEYVDATECLHRGLHQSSPISVEADVACYSDHVDAFRHQLRFRPIHIRLLPTAHNHLAPVQTEAAPDV